MAHIVPSDIARVEMAGGSRHEIDTVRLLQATLPATFTVFHSVHWTQERPGETRFGELDFVVVSGTDGVLVIEQKNGTLEETPDGLIAHYADTSKHVVRQVQRSLDNVRDKFARRHPTRLAMDYLIYCPGYRLRKVNAAALDPSRIVDSEARGRLAERIVECLGGAGVARWGCRDGGPRRDRRRGRRTSRDRRRRASPRV